MLWLHKVHSETLQSMGYLCFFEKQLELAALSLFKLNNIIYKYNRI